MNDVLSRAVAISYVYDGRRSASQLHRDIAPGRHCVHVFCRYCRDERFADAVLRISYEMRYVGHHRDETKRPTSSNKPHRQPAPSTTISTVNPLICVFIYSFIKQCRWPGRQNRRHNFLFQQEMSSTRIKL